MNKIIIVDDHSLFREGIKLLIENEGLGQVIAEAENGREFLDLLGTHKPDLVIMDIEMPVLDGIQATKIALTLYPEMKILILTMLSERANYVELILSGAVGFVLKTSGKNEFEKAIKAILSGESYFSYHTMQCLVDENKQNNQISSGIEENKSVKLTERETEVLQFLCDGLSVSEIASKLFLSVKTIETHRSNLLRKTNSTNTINLVLYAIKNKF
jgi:DNA-binding NarL/FixJ family response regulator